MASAPVAVPALRELHDPLSYLPCSTISAYKRGKVIYDESAAPPNLYVIIEGTVKVSRCSFSYRKAVVDLYSQRQFFGERVLLRSAAGFERAVALEATKVMEWPAEDIEILCLHQPRLAIALLQVVAQRTLELTRRIESFSTGHINQRLARSLIDFVGRFGTTMEDGFVRLPPFTHELLAQYIGTSREVVTHFMNRLRSSGHIGYSRQGISIDCRALSDWLRFDSV